MAVGAWRNIVELEESLNLQELFGLLETIRELNHQEHRFLASLQGVDMDKQGGYQGIDEESPDIIENVGSATHNFGIGYTVEGE